MRTKDRDDYRGMTDRELLWEIREALHVNYEDMAKVLAARLASECAYSDPSYVAAYVAANAALTTHDE